MKTVCLSDVCDLVAGFAFKSQDFGNYENKVIKITNINPPYVDTESLIGVDVSKYDKQKLNKFMTFPGDYVLAMTGATIGKQPLSSQVLKKTGAMTLPITKPPAFLFGI